MNNVQRQQTLLDTTGETTYYYQRDYYKLGSDGKADKQTNTVTIPGNSNIMLEGFAKKDTNDRSVLHPGRHAENDQPDVLYRKQSERSQ